MDSPDYYALLSVSPSASTKEIRRAYIRISRIIHPDRFDPRHQKEDWQQANEMLSQVNAAYAVLKEPAKRAAYDRRKGYTVSEPAASSTVRQEASQSYSSPPPDPGPDPRQEIRAGQAPFEKLPDSIKKLSPCPW
ncbi:MAG: J domain-containing protein [Cyclonatronaceae bacterium]